MAAGLSIVSQSDFSGGIWSTPTRERIPVNGIADAVNVLIDDTGGLYKRGGSTFFSGSSGVSTRIVWVWQGALASGNVTLFATTSNLYRWDAGTITLIGAYTGMANGANRPTVLSGKMYLPPFGTYDGTTFGSFANYNYNTTVANRLVIGQSGNTVLFSGFNTTAFAAGDVWNIPGGAAINGLATLRDAAIVFTDHGTWVISNMAYNLTDPAGNVQQRLDLYSPDLVLWGTGSAGVVGYEGGLVVPARDGVWLMRLGTTSEVATPLQLLSRPIASLYRSYITAGYKPGQAAVFRGHYFLPILNYPVGGGQPFVEDFLVCRLDLPSHPWTRFTGGGASMALTPSQDGISLIGNSAGIANWQLANMDYFGTTADDAGTFTMGWSIITRDYLTGPLNKNTVVKLRGGYHASSGGLIASAVDPADPTNVISLVGTAPSTSGALSTFSWPVGKRSRLLRFLIVDATSTSTGLALDSLEMFVRSQGRQ